MASKVYDGDLSVFTLGGASQLDYTMRAQMVTDPTLDDGSAVTSGGERAEVVKRGFSIECSLLSTGSVNTASRACNLDLSAFSIGGVDYISYVKGGSFNGSYPCFDSSGAGDVWKWMQTEANRTKVTVTVDLLIPRATATANALRVLGALIDTNDAEDALVALSFALNGVTVALGVTIGNVTMEQARGGGAFLFRVTLEGRAPVSGDFITSPAGTTSLFEKFCNAPATGLAFGFTPFGTVSYGRGWTGDGTSHGVAWESFNFSWEDGKIVTSEIRFQGFGQPQGANT